ncbi:MAG: ABC transporter substrate-binding protein [Candidatus ainarchaeum sp.]|nr:ABC transporter substrate-binding protein [Candidatus ainarchaeum sp.]
MVGTGKRLFAAMALIAVLSAAACFSGCIGGAGGPEATPTPTPEATPAPTPVPALKGPASDEVAFMRVETGQAASALQSGEIDYYLTGLSPDVAAWLSTDPEIRLFLSPSAFHGIILNPAPGNGSGFNPFSIRDVRFAVQYLLDRQGISQSVFKGYAVPALVPIPESHPSYEVVRGAVQEFNISFDRAKAGELISRGMESAGAEKVGGRWVLDGKNVSINVIIPGERETAAAILESVSLELEREGFAVERAYYNRSQNSPVYYSDPGRLEWNVGAETWIYYRIGENLGAAFPTLPEKEGWWEYNSSELKLAEDRLDNYSSEAEWADANRMMARVGLNDSIGIWVACESSIFAARSDVAGLTEDRFLGLRAIANAREAYVPGSARLKIGSEETYVPGDSWNPYIVEHIYAMDIANTIKDPVFWSSPTTLETKPYRWNYSIAASDAAGSVAVPQDAFYWNASLEAWAPVAAGTTAKTKVSYDLSKYVGAKWHDGNAITWGDVIYTTAECWDSAVDPEKRSLGGENWDGYVKRIVAIKVSGNTLEMFTNDWGLSDEDTLYASGIYRRLMPWHLNAAIGKLVFEEKSMALQEYYVPEGSNVSPLNLANASHAEAVLAAMASLDYPKIAARTTLAGRNYASEAELAERIAQTGAWYRAHGHLVISDGAYYVDSYDSSDGTVRLKANRDPSYPFTRGEALPR